MIVNIPLSQIGADLLELLAPRSGECILDLGCGTSHLTYKIATSGAEVLGIDSASTMIEQARKNYPHLDFEVADGKICTLQNNLMQSSNAVLHWIKEPERAGVYDR